MRRQRFFKIWVQQQCFLMLFLTIFMLTTVSVILRNAEFKQELNMKISTTEMTTAAYSITNFKSVTKSMKELGKMDEINSYVLFLNFIPNCGAEVLIFLLQKLQGFNSYRHVRLKQQPNRLTDLEEGRKVDEIYSEIRNAAVPLSFDQHIRFINFTKFDKQSPTFISLIRDPMDNILSRINGKVINHDEIITCLQENSNCYQKYFESYIPHFCGHQVICNDFNTFDALQIAKNNVEKYYPVVGVLSEFNATLEVLESKVPYFFKGVQDIYKKTVIDKFNNKKLKLEADKDFQKKLYIVMKYEYEFFNWIKGRLFQQLQIMYGEHHAH